MKIINVDPTEHTATFELDHGTRFTAVNLHEDVVMEIEREFGVAPHTMLDTPSKETQAPSKKRSNPGPDDSVDYVG